MQIIVTILILILMLGILVGMHELGHLAVAKAFNVYCLEYSIGFGPKVFSRTRKGGETAFSIRALPLGGYVSMYGEGVELPEGKIVPSERSLEGAKAWKRAFIMVAGVAVNFFLAFLFTMIYAVAFPSYYTGSYVDTGLTNNLTYVDSSDKESATAKEYCFWIEGSVNGELLDSNTNKLLALDVVTDDKNNQYGYLLDSNASVGDKNYCAVFAFESVVNSNDLLSCVTFYEQKTGFFPNGIQEELGVTSYPDKEHPYTLKEGEEATLHLTFLTSKSYDVAPTREEFQASKNNVKTLVIQGGEKYTSDDRLKINAYEYWAPFGKRLLNGCVYFKNFFVMIGEGLASIFSFNFSNMGSVVAMGSVLSTSSSQIGWGRTFFLYGGFLSLNLGVLNLLPFPGLDGWQLLVTFVESIFHKKINDKVKNIVSFIGVALLLLLGIVIIIKDIVGLFI